jgi:hypothetical protein
MKRLSITFFVLLFCLCGSFSQSVFAMTEIIYSTDFTSNDVFDDGWTTESLYSTSTASWMLGSEWIDDYGQFPYTYLGDEYAWMLGAIGSDSDAYYDSMDTLLTTSTFVLEDIYDEASLSFYSYFRNYSTADYVELRISTDGGTTWTVLYSIDGITTEELVTLDLTAYIGSEIILQYEYAPTGTWEWWWFIDDFELSATLYDVMTVYGTEFLADTNVSDSFLLAMTAEADLMQLDTEFRAVFSLLSDMSLAQRQEALNDMTGAGALSTTDALAASSHEVMTSAIAQRLSTLRQRAATERQLTDDETAQYSPVGKSGEVIENLWFTPSLLSSDTDSRGTLDGYSELIRNLAFGTDFQPTPNLRVGALYDFSTATLTTDDDDNLSLKTYTLGAYAQYTQPTYYINGLVSHSWNRYSLDRYLDFDTLQYTAESQHSGMTEAFEIESGRNYEIKHVSIQPYAAVKLAWYTEDAYTESGADSWNLQVDASSRNSAIFQPGVRISYLLQDDNGLQYQPQLNIAVQRELRDLSTTKSVAFSNLSEISFVSDGISFERTTGLLGLSLDVFATDQFRVQLSASSEFTSSLSQNQLSAQVFYAW